ncbi:MAG TPA: efflux RND transporter periplasmic adaptor subunit [Kofleriaceae bacterium]|nr:efflux RND transporter periplasmic adaptor subunit [Kofleriaceae bacterium]
MTNVKSPLVSSLLLLAPLLLSCGKTSSGEELPPAAGQGAPPREQLPAVAPAVTASVGSGGTERTTGTTYPLDRAEVSPDMSAIIASIDVEEGDEVKKGQVLFRMRTSALGLGVQQAQAALRSAEVALSASKVEHDRMQRLLAQNATDQAQYDRVKAQYDTASVGVEQAKVALAQARRGLTDATVRSPIDGVVTEVRKNAGEMATMMPITVVLVVEDQSTLELRFRLPESALSALEPGDSVTASFEAIKAERTARVHRISPALDLRSRTFEVIATIDNRDRKLKSGMLAIVQLGAPDKKAEAAAPGKAGAERKGD